MIYLNIVIIGICGKMGSLIYEYLKNSYNIIGIDKIKHKEVPTYKTLDEIDNPNLVIDFSSISCHELLVKAIERKIPVFSGTTGYDKKTIEALNDLAIANDSIFVWKPNYAKGINLFSRILEECKEEFKIIDFVEIHETTKKDAPSGTAKMLAEILGINENKIQSVRLNFAPATHELIFYSDSERITLKHEIYDKLAFVIGLIDEIKKYGVDDDVRNIV